MEELKFYVEHLFRHYGHSAEVKELKEEIFSNLMAKKADLVAGGMAESDALIKIKESITDVHGLIDGNKLIDKGQFKIELLQQILIYSIIAWIVLIPCNILRNGAVLSFFIGFTILITGAIYLSERKKYLISTTNRYGYVNLNRFNKIKKLGWVMWSIYIGLTIVKTTGIHFASNIWFQRPISIDGPYQFAILIMEYLAPLVTIIIPLLLSRLERLVYKYEVNGHD
jgi:hypothetical protein